jgi:glycosyltransferase involved in cell wall biosynthesis
VKAQPAVIASRFRSARQPLGTAGQAARAGIDRAKKKLLYLALCDPDLPVTGATVRMGALVSQLARSYDVTLLNMAGSGHPVERATEERFRDRNNRLGVVRRVRVEFSRSGYFLLSRPLYREAEKLCKSHSFDYLLADYGLAGVYGKLFARRYGIPLIYSSHNVEYRMYLALGRYDARRAMLAPYVYWAEKAACRAANLVVAISEHDRRVYSKWIPAERIEVIPQGFDPAVENPFYEAPPSSPAVILFVGSFRAEANRRAAQQIVHEIAPKVLRARPDARFQLVGAQPPVDLRGANIDMRGFVDDLGPYMRRANLVIAPMPIAHGMSTKIVTALAFGKPVLTTPEGLGAIPRRFKQLSVAPLDEFAPAIIELLATCSAVDASEFAVLCDTFAWSTFGTRLAQRIEQCCARPEDAGN